MAAWHKSDWGLFYAIPIYLLKRFE